MKQIVCGLDRRLRIALGLALLGFALSHEDADGGVPLSSVLAGYAAAELFLINGLLQWCPLNYALGIDTCECDWPARIRGGGGPRNRRRDRVRSPTPASLN